MNIRSILYYVMMYMPHTAVRVPSIGRAPSFGRAPFDFIGLSTQQPGNVRSKTGSCCKGPSFLSQSRRSQARLRSVGGACAPLFFACFVFADRRT